MDKNKLKEKLEFLAKDEEEAIEGYDKVISELDEEEDKELLEQLKKIREEEQAHLDFLKEAMDNPDAKYVDPSDDNPPEGDEDEEEDLEESAERKAASIVFKIDLTKGE